MTAPLVDVIASLDAARAAGALTAEAHAGALPRARAIHYRSRTFRDALPAGVSVVSRKRDDAIALLERLARERPEPRPPQPELHRPTIFVRRLAAWVACRPVRFAARWLPEDEQLARIARLLGPRYPLLRTLALARALCGAVGTAPAATAPETERQLARLYGLVTAPEIPSVTSARRIVVALARAWHALDARLAEERARPSPPDEQLLAYAAGLQTERLGLASRADLERWLVANDLTDPREHTAFVRCAFAIEHGLDPRALGLWGVEIDLARSWLVDAMDATGVLEEALEDRARRWPQLAREARGWWEAMPAPLREARAADCDLAGWAEIDRITRAADPRGA